MHHTSYLLLNIACFKKKKGRRKKERSDGQNIPPDTRQCYKALHISVSQDREGNLNDVEPKV